MKGLPILIRLARQRADDRRTALAEAGRQVAATEEALAAQDQAFTQETEQARGRAEEMALWSAWSPMASGRRRQMLHAASLLRTQEDTLRAALREDFAEIKRLELARDAAALATRRQAARRAEVAAEEEESQRHRASATVLLAD
ncbi:hypothetical protein [Roseomonas marmotae]|nr:hypothetical protein [Roseomonas marmotae]